MYTKVFPCLNLHRDRALARTMWTSLSKFPERIFPSCHELSFRYSMNCLNWSFSRFNRESIVYFSNYRRFFPGLHVLPIKTIVTTISLDILFFFLCFSLRFPINRYKFLSVFYISHRWFPNHHENMFKGLNFCTRDREKERERECAMKLHRIWVTLYIWSFKNERGRGRYGTLGCPRKLTSIPNERACKVGGNFIKYLRQPLLTCESCLTNRPWRDEFWRVVYVNQNENTIINEQTRT